MMCAPPAISQRRTRSPAPPWRLSHGASKSAQPSPRPHSQLEDYFERLESARDRDASPPSVDRFTDAQLDSLQQICFGGPGEFDNTDYTECAICTDEFDSGESLYVLPCAAKHAFHQSCVRAWLTREHHTPTHA